MVGGRIESGDHVGVFINLKNGGLEGKGETTQLSVHKVLVTSVQRAPVATPSPQPTASGAAGTPSEDTSLPTGMLLLTVAVSEEDATKIVYASNFTDIASVWLSKEPLDAAEGNRPGIMTRPEVYK